ncbi:DUF1283 family protein [Martelella alba]|uniref:DUF1283 family protein n=1 Tax=Martelella alba TaxID=2590451 RepID=A0ABY2SKQ9_9HYPH|nr:DUF1283 family protein [Martelella alba]TKI05682.1 DUF1283 family protein [Martelella alba]
MKKISAQHLLFALLAFSGAVGAATQHVIIDSGDNALSREHARENQEQWDATRALRGKVNQRVEKDFDKYDNAVDLQEKCANSDNVNAYWEPNTARCLDRRTGRVILR